MRWIPLVFFAFLGIFLGMAGYTFHYARGTSYLSNDPKACVNCHVMQEHYDSWVKSSHHAAATCNDCHIPHEFPWKYMAKMRNGWNHSKAFTLQNFPEPIRITRKNLRALQNNCLHCHETLTSGIVGHESADIQRCTECHRSVGHMSLSN
jgi:cytochrome c nitrite reductase small subunit